MSIKGQALVGTLGGLLGGLIVAGVFRLVSEAPLQEVSLLIGLGFVVGAISLQLLVSKLRPETPRRRTRTARAPTSESAPASDPAKKKAASK